MIVAQFRFLDDFWGKKVIKSITKDTEDTVASVNSSSVLKHLQLPHSVMT